MKDLEQIQPEEMPPELPPEINAAFDRFFDITSDAGMWERFDMLSAAIVEYRIYLLNRHRKLGKKRLTEEDVFLFECNEHLKHIEKILMTAKKLGRLAAPSTGIYDDKDWLRRVKESTTLGSIVRNMNEKTA